MKIKSLIIAGFQCFGDSPTTIEIENLTTLIGANGCGKSAVLQSLCRMFGVTSVLRHLRKADFHVPVNKCAEDFEELSLSIEVLLAFPELEDDDADEDAIPECFNQMLVDDEASTPFCRIRLEGKWHRTNLAEGEIEESLFWITTSGEPDEEDRKPVRPHERAQIHVHYVPAVRDPLKQLKQASGTILGRLLLATNWSVEARRAIDEASTTVSTTFRSEAAVALIEKEAGKTWQALQKFPSIKNIQLRPLESRVEELLRQVEICFTDDDEASHVDVDRLSDGLRSLFYFSLLVSSFRIEQTACRAADDAEPGAFSKEAIIAPTLTVFAVEEPENHLAAHYLGRIVQLLDDVSKDSAAQVLLTSHSPSILGRVDPVRVRHLRLDETSRTTTVRPVRLPPREKDSHKFIKEAVLAYPELYFARLVILGEGDSEEIVLKRLATVFDLGADAYSLSVVPLGGRHVNHMWKLLTDLQIPFVTLLDLDREREGGGWGRVKYACAQLGANGVPRAALYTVTSEKGDRVLNEDEVKEMHTWDVTQVQSLSTWTTSLEKYSVYFTSPLDLDFSMLTAFTEEYKDAGIRGPNVPKEGTPEYSEKLKSALIATLKGNNSGGSTFSDTDKALFIWYAYLFLGQGKPTTHISALNSVSDAELKNRCPAVLRRVFKRISERLKAVD